MECVYYITPVLVLAVLLQYAQATDIALTEGE